MAAKKSGPKMLTEDEKDARRLAAMVSAETALVEIEGLPPREDIPKYAYAVAMRTLVGVLSGEYLMPSDAKAAMEVANGAFKMAQTAMGLPSSVSAPADKAALKDWVREMQARKQANDG